LLVLFVIVIVRIASLTRAERTSRGRSACEFVAAERPALAVERRPRHEQRDLRLWYDGAAEEPARLYNWGVSWQITPRVPTDALAACGDKAKRAFDAMMHMGKISVAAIEAAMRR
jgi:hypothetical protein